MCTRIRQEEIENNIKRYLPDFVKHHKSGERVNLEEVTDLQVLLHGNGRWEITGIWEGDFIYFFNQVDYEGSSWVWAYLKE